MADVMKTEGGRVLYIVSTWVPADQLDEWSRWYTEVHMPDVVAQPQIQRARKYRVVEDSRPAEWTPQYVTVYELDSLADFESYRTGPEGTRLREDYASHYGASGKISRQILIEEVAFIGDGK